MVTPRVQTGGLLAASRICVCQLALERRVRERITEAAPTENRTSMTVFALFKLPGSLYSELQHGTLRRTVDAISTIPNSPPLNHCG